jgi:hypothetical protein
MPKIIFPLVFLLLFFVKPFAFQSSDITIVRISNSVADTNERTSSLAGTTFYVKGSGFSLQNDNNFVYVNGVRAIVSGRMMI